MASRSPSEFRRVSPVVSVLAVVIACASMHCDEDLPAVVQPKDVLVGSISLRVGANGFVLLGAGSTPAGTDGAVDIRITSLYNDVLSDSEDVHIEAIIFQSSHPERRDTVRADRDAIEDPSMLIRYLLTIPPNKPLRLVTQWSHKFAGDSTFASVADKDTVFVEKGVEVTAYKVIFTLSARVKLFKKYQTLAIKENQFTVYYRWGVTGSR